MNVGITSSLDVVSPSFNHALKLLCRQDGHAHKSIAGQPFCPKRKTTPPLRQKQKSLGPIELSALGQKQTYAAQHAMSAKGQKRTLIRL